MYWIAANHEALDERTYFWRIIFGFIFSLDCLCCTLSDGIRNLRNFFFFFSVFSFYNSKISPGRCYDLFLSGVLVIGLLIIWQRPQFVSGTLTALMYSSWGLLVERIDTVVSFTLLNFYYLFSDIDFFIEMFLIIIVVVVCYLSNLIRHETIFQFLMCR